MATSSVRGPTMVGTTGTTWATTANAVDGLVGVNNATYATWTNAVSSGVGTIDIGGFNFASIVGASDTLTSVSVSLRHLVSNTGRITSITIQAFDGTTAIGTPQNATLNIAAHNDAVTVTPTLAQLRSANFKIRVTATHAANTQSLIWSVDYVDITVVYTPPPTNLTLSPANLTLVAQALGVTLGATADPADLLVEVTGPTTATLTWDAAALAGVDDYSVFRRTPATGVPFDPTVDTPVASGVATLTYPATGLTPATEYEWQVFGRVSGAWTPADLPGLAAWYDASDLATITASAGAVSQWNDKSGLGRHLTQALATYQPATGTRTINSLNALDFTSDRMDNAVAVPQPLTCICVAQTDTTGILAAVMAGPNLLLYARSGKYAYYAGTEVEGPGSWDTNPHQVSAVFNGASSGLWVDGSVQTTTNPGTSGLGSLVVGNNTGDSLRWDGLIAELVIYDHALSDTDRVTVEGYLAAKWGL